MYSTFKNLPDEAWFSESCWYSFLVYWFVVAKQFGIRDVSITEYQSHSNESPCWPHFNDLFIILQGKGTRGLFLLFLPYESCFLWHRYELLSVCDTCWIETTLLWSWGEIMQLPNHRRRNESRASDFRRLETFAKEIRQLSWKEAIKLYCLQRLFVGYYKNGLL